MNLVWRAVSFSLGLVSIALNAQDLRLEPLASFGPNGDGSLRPGDRPYLTGIISWPASHSGFTLESTATLPDGWAPMSDPVVVEGDNNTVTIEANAARSFFRLSR